MRSNSAAGAKVPDAVHSVHLACLRTGWGIENPRDAILAAANLLRQAGAPRSYALRFLYCWAP